MPIVAGMPASLGRDARTGGETIISTGISRDLLAGILWPLADAAPVWPQSSAAAFSQFIGVGEQATSTFNSMAMQHQALEMQREQLQAQRQQQENALEQLALEAPRY